ncbi:hypothetical protein SAMN05660297_03489 [Natronincola peptidivorans]|uniref:Wadjet protein JetD C-terminal domain-containing protein n=1 Tax=Natronincola peptidivorans TaxID=426128 RepID=A0A1I0H3T4_9FIRM|nr:Wadjet anti-phage system protein JetD domain-containing protein [Natronincola peptidivorans]SET78234.1 hypothetical protein SAMN05660297_03489 [Natronincola peptidivorans]
MEKIIKKFLSEYKKKNKKRFGLQALESYLIDRYKGEHFYLEGGGYQELYRQMCLLKEKQYIKEIKSSSYNGFHPPLKTKWQIVCEEDSSRWDKSKMLQLSDYLDFSYYVKHPSYQTDLEWEYIENIYSFLKSRDKREWASIEERSLELFYDEKFLKSKKEVSKGKYGILKRLKLSNEDLKMKRYGEMFIYWNRGVEDIKNIIILENHSTFFTYKRAAQVHGEIFGFRPDALIYGEGKKVEDSLSFIEEITDSAKVDILYFGDIDAEGFGIYYRLKERYKDINIKLQHEAYTHLIALCIKEYSSEGHNKNQLYLDGFLEEMKPYLKNGDLKKMKSIWDKDLRVPQELINYEYLLKVRK